MNARSKIDYYYALYLECISDKVKTDFVLRNYSEQRKADDKVKKLITIIENEAFNRITAEFRELMDAKTVYMFQAKKGCEIDFNSTIIRLDVSKSNNDRSKGDSDIKLLRSELRDYYINFDGNKGFNPTRPSSRCICEIKDTVRIVKVKGEQDDESVWRFSRQPCIIAYVRLDYIDEMDSKNEKQVFFAFVYDDEENPSILKYLKLLRGFLSFRYHLVKRIEKDFKGDLYAERAETLWRQKMLSIERAGCHSDSSTLGALITESQFEDLAVTTLFGDKEKMDEPGQRRITYQLIYNNLIAMYYRKVIGDTNDENESGEKQYTRLFDNLTKEIEVVGDLVKFSEIKDLVFIGMNAETIDLLKLFGRKSGPISGFGLRINTGMGNKQRVTTFDPKYLRTFLIDVLSNAQKHGGRTESGQVEVKVSVENAEGDTSADFLVFENIIDVKNDSDNGAMICWEKNYDLKASIELDYEDFKEKTKKGISLGSMADFVSYGGILKAFYRIKQRNNKDGRYFTVKLPIIKIAGGLLDG